MKFEGLDKLVTQGQNLLDEDSDSVSMHSAFNDWVRDVSNWLNMNFPDSGLLADWAAQGDSRLVLGGAYYDEPETWVSFRRCVQGRLKWISQLSIKANPTKTTAKLFVNTGRINDLKGLQQNKYDLSRLIRLCEEINLCFAVGCYLATIVLVRAILDHLPPIFDCQKFSEVANNYGGAKSFKEAMQRLENSSRKVADLYLHCEIRKTEILPNATQVDYSNEVDLLLAEVVRVLK